MGYWWFLQIGQFTVKAHPALFGGVRGRGEPKKAWDIGGFCKSATGGTDHAGPTWGFIGSNHTGPTWGFIGGSDCLLWRPTQLYLGSQGRGRGWAKKRRHYYNPVYNWRTIIIQSTIDIHIQNAHKNTRRRLNFELSVEVHRTNKKNEEKNTKHTIW